MPRHAVTSPAAATVGPYSHAVWAGDLLYLSGQTPIDPSTGKLAEGDLGDQTRQCFVNLFDVPAAASLAPEDLIKVNVYLTDMADFAAMNAVYAGQFEKPYPARTTIAVAGLPLGARVEIELVARWPGK
jgi:2-iminobutanoate/2-iminopropanoate deaminase